MAADRGDTPLRVGLVGAGPWARALHAPALHAHPRTKLVAVFARRERAAAELAAPYGATVARSFKELMSTVDAISFAVPPGIQAPLATHAAQAGRHLILEKPIASTVDEAEALVAAADEAAVATIVVFTRRFSKSTIDWLEQAHRLGGWSGGTARFLSSTLLDGKFAGSAWRHEGGALADVGPHALDLMDAALGEVVGVLGAYRGEPDLWQVVLSHATGAISTLCMSMRLPVRPSISDAAIYGRHGYLELPQRVESAQDCFHRLLDDFVGMVHNGQTEHRCDVSRGLHVQRLVQNIAQLVGAGGRFSGAGPAAAAGSR